MLPAASDPLWEIVELHLDEAEFLWEMWEHSLVAPNYTLDEVARGPEERLFAHIDGLVVNGPLVALKLLIPALEDSEPGRTTAAAAALLAGFGEPGVDAVFEALRELPEQRAALRRAIECAESPALRPRVRALLAEDDEGLVLEAARALHFWGEPLGEALTELLLSDDPAARALALSASCDEPGGSSPARAIQAALAELDPVVVDAAIVAGARLGLAPAWARARVRAGERDGGAAMLLLALRGEGTDGALLLHALSDRKRRAAALFALGFLGTPEAVDASTEWLDDEAVGPLAGEVFAAVTGIDLAADGLVSSAPDTDEALVHTPERSLPRPEPMAVMQRWMKIRGEFVDGRRHVAGAPRSPAALLGALARGPMRRRPAIFLDLALHERTGARRRLQTRAPTRRQRAELAALVQTFAAHGRPERPGDGR